METKEYICRGCGQPIIAGQMRRGDDWHAECFGALERRLEARPTKAVPFKRIKGLTTTQTIILEAAIESPSGSVGFGRGDRKGTRIVKIDDMERPWIVAYSYPEFFMASRGLLEKSNEPYVYRITDAGRALWAASRA